MAFQGIGTGFNMVAASTAAQSVTIPQQTPYLRVVTGIGTAHIAIGTNPTATTTDTVISNQQPEIISLGQVISQGITTCTLPSAGDGVTGITTLTVPSGYGSQFIEGNLLNLTVNQGAGSTDAQSYYNLDNLYVSEVVTKRTPDGYFNDRITVTGDMKVQALAGLSGIQTGLFSENSLLARKAFKVSVQTGGNNGTVYCHQVQITGG